MTDEEKQLTKANEVYEGYIIAWKEIVLPKESE